MLVPKNNRVASSDETSTETQESETLPQAEKDSHKPITNE